MEAAGERDEGYLRPQPEQAEFRGAVPVRVQHGSAQVWLLLVRERGEDDLSEVGGCRQGSLDDVGRGLFLHLHIYLDSSIQEVQICNFLHRKDCRN